MNRAHQKRIGALLLSLCMLFAWMIPTSAHSEKTTFSLSATDGDVGDTITVSWNITADSYFTNCTFLIKYDPTVVKYLSVDAGEITPSASMFESNNNEADGTVKTAYILLKAIKKQGALLDFQFQILKKAPAEFSMEMYECVGEENDTSFDLNYVLQGCTVNADSVGTPTQPTTASASSALGTTTQIAPIATTQSGAQGTTADGAVPSSDGGSATSIVTIPVTVTEANGTPVTDAQGIVQTTFITASVTVTTQMGETQPTATAASDEEQKDPASDNPLMIVLVAAIVLIAIGVAVALYVVSTKKKKVASEDAAAPNKEDKSDIGNPPDAQQ